MTQDFHRNPRQVWYTKLQDVTINGDYEATFELSEPQPSLPVLLASAFSAVYPCHVPQAGDAHQAGRHRAVQIRRVQARRPRSVWCAIRITGKRTVPISMRSRFG